MGIQQQFVSFFRRAAYDVLVFVGCAGFAPGLFAQTQLPTVPEEWHVDSNTASAVVAAAQATPSSQAESEMVDAGIVGGSPELNFPELNFFGPSAGQDTVFADTASINNRSSQLVNNFTAFPDFDTGIVIRNGDVAMKIGGYVKADLIYDLDAIGTQDTFDTTSILTDGVDRQNARFHARQSRLSFDTRWLVGQDMIRAFVEADFFGGEDGGNGSLRLRHAYGTLGRFTTGQTWTTFTDPAAVPQTLDFEGAVSSVNRRQGLVRIDQPLFLDGLSWAVALEDPQIIIRSDGMLDGEGRNETPDFLSRVRLERDWGSTQLALVLRQLGFQPFGEPVLKKNAWGLNLAGSILVLESTRSYYQITYGEGIGSYRGSPDVVQTGPESGSILPVFGWMVGVHHEWTSRLTSNLTFSELSLEKIPGQEESNLRGTTYFAVNLIANPYERVFWGVEYLYGVREDVGGARGSANRLQTSFGFYLP